MDATPLASRRAAVDVLMACLDKGQPLDDALAGHRGFTALDPRDRAFVRLLLATTVRHLGEMQYRGALVLISGEDERILRTAERLARAHGLQVVGALHKPVSPEQLAKAVSAAGHAAPQRPKPQCLGIPVFDVDARVVDPATLVGAPK